ncbi:hypothetical protein GCM10007981_18080 [Thermocladium modestius]|uniref:Uncharacterized protein n=1 Tax=Thermocladium modestius TaxID=62609 RepID=A0A830GXR1_9CREN|nr:hypothetical protein [Thermocladium modestius]GGP22354.1 hypothetical protein GCM10007981_18080 [Thermocladium modestius]
MDTERALLIMLAIALAIMIAMYADLYVETYYSYNQLTQKYAALESSYANLYLSYNQLSSSFTKLSSYYAGLNSTYMGLTEKVVETSNQLNYCRSNLTIAVSNNTQLAQELSYYKESLNILTSKNESLSMELNKLIQIDSSLKANNSLLQSQVNQLNSTIYSINSSYNSLLARYAVTKYYYEVYGNASNGVSCNITLIPQANNTTLIASGSASQPVRSEMLGWDQSSAPQVYVLLLIPDESAPLAAFSTVLSIGSSSWSLSTVLPSTSNGGYITMESSVNAYIKTLTIHTTLQEGNKYIAAIAIVPGTNALSLLNAANIVSQTCILEVMKPG